MSEQNPLEDIQFNGANLYKEETFTDLEVGTIRKLTRSIVMEAKIRIAKPLLRQQPIL